MNTDKLSKWADLLLDTGKRNNLINFKDTKLSTLDVLSPDVATLFTRAEHSAVFEVYDPKLDEDDEDSTADGQTPIRTTLRADERLTRAEYLARYEKKLKKNQILVFNDINKPISALKVISKKAKTAVEETGVNIAYFAFGFIEWTEGETAPAVMRAPILLAPISLENESSIEPYRIKVTDDEIIVNPTFAFKLQHEYGIKIPDFDEEEGLDGYFSKIQELVSKLKWKVSAACKIGIFSFLKINMYKDLKDNADTIVGNKGVRALLGDFGEKTDLGVEENVHGIDLLDLHNVVDADSSQAQAIEMAVQGKSFVLQGPPGTGKSQTITNVIAECLLNGKKVLFVSEKLAALNVVYEKLKNVGLEEFCLELHSHKANKKQVIEELCRTLKLPKSGVSEQAFKEIKEKKEAQQTLDGYAVELHKVRPVIERTLYGLYEEISACRFAPDTGYVVGNLLQKGAAYIENAETALSRYVAYIPSIGYDYKRNVWYGYAGTDASYASCMKVKADLFEGLELCKEIKSASEILLKEYDIEIRTLLQAHTYEQFFALVKDSGFITPALLNGQTLQKTLTSVKKMQTLASDLLKNQRALDENFDEDIYKLDGQTAHKKLTKQFSGFFSRLFSSEYKRIVAKLKLCSKDGKLGYKNAVATFARLSAYQRQRKEFNGLETGVSNLLGEDYDGVNTSFAKCIADLEALLEIQKQTIAFGRLATINKSAFTQQRSVFGELFERLHTAFCKYGETEKRLISYFDKRECDLEKAPLTYLEKKYTGCYESVDKLDNWCQFAQLLRSLETLELRSFIDFCIQKNIQPNKILLAYKKAFYSQWVDVILKDVPFLFSLSRVPHDEVLSRFRDKDRIHFEINKAKIKAVLSAQRPNLDLIAQGSSVSVLLREGEKKRKQKGIRVLLSEIGELAQTLKPCFLMSPLSVSTYLGSDMQFDVVIFDEASQIFPQDAVGAIYRGKQLIVVGDSKQMPPSNFFNSSVDIDEDEESEDITDFESILDLCSTAFPQRRLKWHYRSRFEQLISFSNKNFYENDLVTFPSSMTDKTGVGVDYIHVNGVFDRKTKTNRAEAERIVELVFEHIEKYPERSLGVVAFSISQQNLIDKLLAKKRQSDPSKDAFFKSDKVEPFFIKNLETVQGDERDTIIFSIAYAKDEQGKLLANFGPVNREGGERRLNVAVTRAKYNVKIVSSMHYSDIDLSGSKSLGARLLRDYLDYAENGEVALQRMDGGNAYEQNASHFESEICEFLREQGCVVDTQVGCSSFKIDIAVKRPDSDDYVLAIECDGIGYRTSKTARDRDRLRQDILERMGWKFYRIWSTDWFRNKRLEKERLVSVVKKAFASGTKVKKDNELDVSFERTIQAKPFAFPKYQTVDAVALGNCFKGDILRVVRAVVEIEAPVSEEWLLKRMVALFDGREKVTNVVREQFEKAIVDCQRVGVVRYNGFLYLQGMNPPLLRVPQDGDTPRDVKYIPLEELASGLLALIKQNVTVEKSGLFRLLSTQLGFARVGDAIVARLEKALRVLQNDIEVNGEILSLKEA